MWSEPMRWTWTMVVLAASSALATEHAQTTPVANGPVDVSEVLRPLLEESRVPAMAVMVTRGREVVAQGVWGVRKAGDETKATLEDRWHLGSCTKALTATMLAVLVEEGRLAWDTTLGAVFPEVEKHEKWNGVTLEQLLAHRA